MQAYSVFANEGIKRDFYTIERITTTDGTVIEEHKDSPGKEVFSPAAAYIINKILSDNNARPESTYWRNALTIPGHLVAAKTGTANKPGTSHKTILPGDLWTIGYTPQITTIVWAGNVDGSAMLPKAESLNSAAPIWKAFMEFALKDLPNADWKKPSGIYTYDIVKTSGLLARENTPKDQIVSTIMAVKLDRYDDGGKEIQIDTLCNGPVTATTPPDAIKTLYIPSSKPIIDGYDPDWTAGFFASMKNTSTGTGELATSDTPCTTRPSTPGLVGFELTEENPTSVTVKFNGDRMIQSLSVSADGMDEKIFSYDGSARKTGSETIAHPAGSRTFALSAIDIYGYRYTQVRTIGEIPSG